MKSLMTGGTNYNLLLDQRIFNKNARFSIQCKIQLEIQVSAQKILVQRYSYWTLRDKEFWP